MNNFSVDKRFGINIDSSFVDENEENKSKKILKLS